MTKLKEWFADARYMKLCFYVIFTVGILYIFYFILKHIDIVFGAGVTAVSSILAALSPLLIGLFLAYLISPVVELVDRRLMCRLFLRTPHTAKGQKKQISTRRTASIVFTYLVFFLVFCVVLYVFAFLIIGQFAFQSLTGLLDSVTQYFIQYEDSFRNLAAQIPTGGVEDKLQESAADIAAWISDHFSANAVFTFIGNLGGGILNIVLGIVVSIYLIKDKDYFLGLFEQASTRVLPPRAKKGLDHALYDINQVLSQFLRGQMLDALIIAVLSSIALSVIGLDFAVFIGCFAGLANVIPYFGPFLGMVPAVLIGLLSGGFSQAALAVVLLLVIQQVDSNIIYPRVVGSSTGLHPVAILVSVTVGGYFGGIIGMLIAVPIAASIRLFFIKHPVPETEHDQEKVAP